MLLSRFPRVSLAHLPTPLELLPRLSEHLGGPNVYVKRDDCTGLGTGGNKTRKLEFLMADAVANNADVIITHPPCRERRAPCCTPSRENRRRHARAFSPSRQARQ